jgi:hypothetical protein
MAKLVWWPRWSVGGSWADAGGGTCRARSGVTVCDSARPAQLWAERAWRAGNGEVDSADPTELLG